MEPVTIRVGAPPPPPDFRNCLEELRHAVGSVYQCNPPFTATFDNEAGYEAFMNLSRGGGAPVHVVIEKDTGELEDLHLTELPEWARQAMDQRLADIKAGKRDEVRDQRRQAIQKAKRQKPARKVGGGQQGEPGGRETLSRMLTARLDHLEYGPCPTVKCGLPDGVAKPPQMFSLGPHQQAAVELFAADGVRRLLLAQRTGAGKTFIILGCVKRFLDDHPSSKKRINIVVPTSELVKNINESAPVVFPDAAVNADGFRARGHQIRVGLYHHFARKDGVAWSNPRAVSREAYARQQARADALNLRTQEGKPYRVYVGKTAHRNVFEGAVTFFDEAHYLTEPQELVKQGNVGTAARVLLLAEMIRGASDDAKIVLLTATPASTVADLDNLMDVVVGEHGLELGRSRDEGYVCFFPEDVGAPSNFAEGKWLTPGMQLPQILPVPVIRSDHELTTFAEQYLCGVPGKRNKEDMVKRQGILGGKKECWVQDGGAPKAKQDHTKDKFNSLAVLEHAGGVKTRARTQDFYRFRSTQDRRARMIVEAGDDMAPKMAAVAKYVAGVKGKALIMAHTEHGGLALQKMLESKGVSSRFLLGSSKKEEELGCHTARGQGHNDCKAHADVRDAMTLFNDPKINRYGEKLRCLVLNPPNFQEGVSFCGVETIVLFDVPPDYKALVQRVGRAIRFCSHTSFADRVAVNVVMPVLHLPKAVSIDGKPEIDLTEVVTGDEMAFSVLAEQWSENLRVNCALYGMAVDREFLSAEKRLPSLRAYSARCAPSAPLDRRAAAGPLVLDPPLDQRIADMRACKLNLEMDLSKIKKRDPNAVRADDQSQRYLVTFEATGLPRNELDARVDGLNRTPIRVATYWMGNLESYGAGLSRGSTFVVHMKRTDRGGLGDGLLRWIEKNVGGGVLDAVRRAVGHDAVSLVSIKPVDESLRGNQARQVKSGRSREREQKAIDKYEECVYQVAGGDPPLDPEWIRKGAKGDPPTRERGAHSIPEDAEPHNCPVDVHLLHQVAKQDWEEKMAKAGWFAKAPPEPANPCEPICTDAVLRDARRVKEDMDLLTKECLARGGTKGGCDPHDLYAGYQRDRDRRCLPRPDDKKFVPERSAECDLHIKHRKLVGTPSERQQVSGELDALYQGCLDVENPADAGDRIRREHDRIAKRPAAAAPRAASSLPVVPAPPTQETRAQRAARLGRARGQCAPGDALCLATGKPELKTADPGEVARVTSRPKRGKKKRGTPSRSKKKLDLP